MLPLFPVRCCFSLLRWQQQNTHVAYGNNVCNTTGVHWIVQKNRRVFTCMRIHRSATILFLGATGAPSPSENESVSESPLDNRQLGLKHTLLSIAYLIG